MTHRGPLECKRLTAGLMFGNTSALDLSSEFKIEEIQDSRDSVVRRICSYAGAEMADEDLELGDTGDEASDGEYPCLPS
jgi:hypothetical protein